MTFPADEETETEGAYASPPCFMHELDPSWLGPGAAEEGAGVMRWRKAERARLIENRLALRTETRASHARNIAATLDERIGDPAGRTFALYWPFRGEPDLRP